ncbi:MAG: carboxypeptidase-like regulatory domain-containing protein [Planctomycetota bacterium]|nr:carboxypeptidase-like regulatory domain-containing protein [Planctomycetota bacterium]
MLLVSLTLGCGPDGPEIATVEGTVTLGGEPLAEAMVLFQPSNGRPSAGRTDAEGHYELIYSQGREGALPGEHTVAISTFQAGNPEEGTPKIIERVPAQYNVQTELKETVEAGENVIDFNLKAEGRILDPRQ